MSLITLCVSIMVHLVVSLLLPHPFFLNVTICHDSKVKPFLAFFPFFFFFIIIKLNPHKRGITAALF